MNTTVWVTIGIVAAVVIFAAIYKRNSDAALFGSNGLPANVPTIRASNVSAETPKVYTYTVGPQTMLSRLAHSRILSGVKQ